MGVEPASLMRPSRVLRKLRAGELVFMVKVNLGDARGADLAARCGFDCLWLCREHVPDDYRGLEAIVNAAKMHDVDTAIRVERGSYSDLVRPLEMDGTGIIVPHVMSAEQAKRIAWQTRFHPIGRRAVDGGNADGAYAMMGMTEYMQQANDQRFVIVQIEDFEAMNELDEIAAVEGIDGLFFGAADYSHSLGVPGQWDDPRIAEARKLVAQAAKRHGKIAVVTCGVQAAPAMVELGYRFVNIGADVLGLNKYYREILELAKQCR